MHVQHSYLRRCYYYYDCINYWRVSLLRYHCQFLLLLSFLLSMNIMISVVLLLPLASGCDQSSFKDYECSFFYGRPKGSPLQPLTSGSALQIGLFQVASIWVDDWVNTTYAFMCMYLCSYWCINNNENEQRNHADGFDVRMLLYTERTRTRQAPSYIQIQQQIGITMG